MQTEKESGVKQTHESLFLLRETKKGFMVDTIEVELEEGFKEHS